MNAPSRTETFILAEGEAKLSVEEDTKIPNAANITINKEDHTLANMLRAELLHHPHVLFAGYKVPHPLESRVVLKIQTDGQLTPSQAVSAACDSLIYTLVKVKDQFKVEVERAKLLSGAGVEDQGLASGAAGGGGVGMDGLEGAGGYYGGL